MGHSLLASALITSAQTLTFGSREQSGDLKVTPLCFLECVFEGVHECMSATGCAHDIFFSLRRRLMRKETNDILEHLLTPF